MACATYLMYVLSLEKNANCCCVATTAFDSNSSQFW